jgi:predicted MPP superfamily phosphohydrolase
MNNSEMFSTPDYKIEIRRPARPRRQPADSVLEERWLHQLFLITHIPAEWPTWKLGGGLLVLAGLVALVWRSLNRLGTVAVTGLYLLFALGDWLLFWWLPASNRSFGPVGPQLFVTSIPRLMVTTLSALLTAFTGSLRVGVGVNLFLQLAGTASYLWGTVVEPFAMGLTRQTVTSAGLPDNTQPIRLLHLSDFHVERLTTREPQVLAMIAETRPDLIVITGDYLNLSYVDDPIARRDVREVLARIEAPLGVYATLGSPPVDPRDTTPTLFEGLDNIRLLRDEVALLTLADGRHLSLIGMDCEHDLESDASAFESLFELVPTDSATVLLYHSPELMPLVQNYPLDLYLCGHTHGGQVRVPGYGAILTSSVTGKRYEMSRYDEQGTTLYVSRGIGLEGLSAPRIRLLCRPEIILFTVVPEKHRG